MSDFIKDPQAVLDYSVDWTDWLGTSETIVTSTWTAPDGLTVNSNTHDDKIATAWIQGGTVGKEYRLVNRIVTSNTPSRTDERTVTILVENR